ncbi:hypothetical protein [Sphingobacterium sp. LRF_L2]|uniref:hypothetical protein n=1 Tax=Sphingobacterium sp. LRF_L2 TaxID=3369421 RepID=UPI003F60EE45
MSNKLPNLYFSIILVSILGFATSCESVPPKEKPKYSFFFMTKENKQLLWQTSQLESGGVSPESVGTVLERPARIWYYMLVHDNHYYYVDTKTEYLVKGRLERQSFVRLDSIYLKGFSYSDNAVFLDENSLFIVNHSVGHKRKKYALVNVEDMTADIHELPLDTPESPFDNMSIGFVYKRANKLWLGYTYHFTNKKMGFGSSDTVYVAQLSYPEMKLIHVDKDGRSTYPGNVNTAQENTFEDEKGNFYFMSTPGIARGANPYQPTAIYRIKADEDHIDTNYFFNISSSVIRNHAYGFWYLGNNKAIVRSERKDLFNNYKEHYLVPHIEYYVVDLEDSTAITKLDLPLDRGTSRSCVLVEGKKAYITINDGKGNNDVWIYNTAEKSLKKGLHVSGDVDYIFRLDLLQR